MKPLTSREGCRRASRLVSDAIDEPLARADAAWLGAHVSGCPSCTRMRADLHALCAVAARLAAAPAAPARAPVPPPPAAALSRVGRVVAAAALLTAVAVLGPEVTLPPGGAAPGLGAACSRVRITLPPLPPTVLPTFDELFATPRCGGRS
jgi:hypothetical protein